MACRERDAIEESRYFHHLKKIKFLMIKMLFFFFKKNHNLVTRLYGIIILQKIRNIFVIQNFK